MALTTARAEWSLQRNRSVRGPAGRRAERRAASDRRAAQLDARPCFDPGCC